MERMYLGEQLSSGKIAERLGWPRATVTWWLKRYEIPLRSNSEASRLRKPTEESNRKRSETHKRLGTKPPDRTGVPLTEDHLAKLRETIKIASASRTEEAFAKIAAANKGRKPPNTGKPWTDADRARHAYRQTTEYRKKLSDSQKGEKANNWRGGITPTDERLRGWEWRLRRSECYARDNWTCQDCGVKCHNGVRIQAHHIVSRRLGGGDELENLVTLCASCHRRREAKSRDALFAL